MDVQPVNSSPIRFGLFLAPFHPLDGNPTLQLRRDLDLAQLADGLGFDEMWFGEHHSAGFETIGSPELMIAAAGERTRRIMLGTGVNSVSYHNPLILADRIVQLDHLTGGRVMMGIGPGQLPTDAFMLGIDPVRQRDMMAEAVEALLPLLRGETVTMRTDWFDLHEARVQLLPFSESGIEVGVASVFSPTGVTVAGRHGLSVLSVAASDVRARGQLAANWAIHERVADEHGHAARRDRWRVVGMMHLAESREQARREVEWGVLRSTAYFEGLTGKEMPWRASPESAVEMWTTEGLPSWGVGVVGTPDDAIEAIEQLQQHTGGFGTYLLNVHDCAPWHATRRSYELFAEYVIPHFRRANRNRRASIAWAHANSERFIGRMTQAIEVATHKFGPTGKEPAMAHTLAVTDDTEQGKANLDEFGYTVHEDFLSADELGALRERLEEQADLERAAGVATLSASGHAGSDKYIGAPTPGQPIGYQEVKFLPNKGRIFLDALHKPAMHDYATHLFRGEAYNLATYTGVFLRKGSSRQVLHADQQAIPLVLDRPVMCVMMVCLSDFDADMGATLVAPGTHRRPAPDLHADPDEQVRAAGSQLVPLTARAGSMLLWESRTWHCAGASTSDRTRVSLGIGWAAHFIKPQDFYPAIVHDDVYATLTDADKDLLGFRVVREYAGAIAPRTPGDDRANTNIRYPYVPELTKDGAKQAVPLA